MAYTPINWQTGDTITAEKLNKMDNGWSATSGSSSVLLNETVTTEGSGPAFGTLTYSSQINAPSIVVTLNGVEYTCQYDADINGYGDMSFSDFPFVIDYYDGSNELVTPSAGTYTLQIETAAVATIEVSQGFVSAVALHAVIGTTTFQEVDDALAAGRLVVISESTSGGSLCQVVCATDKTVDPLEVYALSVTYSGASTATYLASSASSPIEAY